MNSDFKILYVMNALRDGDYEILPASISEGTVYKIKYKGSLDVEGIERGFLYIPEGSAVKGHSHNKDLEFYKLVSGFMSVEGVPAEINICGFGYSHGIDLVPVDTIVETCKMNEIFLGETLDSYTSKYSYLKREQKI